MGLEALPWDSQTINRSIRKNLQLKGGDSLDDIKSVVSQLPLAAPSGTTLDLRIDIHTTKYFLKSVFSAFPTTVPSGVTLMIDFMFKATENYPISGT